MSEEQNPQAERGRPENVEEAIEEAAEAVSVQTGQLSELSDGSPSGDPIGLAQLLDVPVQVTVVVGRARLPLGQLVELRPGSLVTLDRESYEPADILVSGKVVARGEVVTLDGSYGVRIVELVGKEKAAP